MARNIKKEVKLSATRISTFLECKLKYWYNYVEHLPKTPNPVFRLGNTVHETLEYAGEIWLEKEDREKFTKKEIAKIFDKYNEVSIREGIEAATVHQEGKDLVKARLKKFISGKRLLALEQKFGMGDSMKITTDLGVPLIGAIDKAEEIDESTLLIVDYKTSKTVPDMDHLRNDIQLSIYDLVARELWPEYNRVILSLDLLRTEMVYTYRTDEEREEFKKYLKELYDQMLAMKKADAKPQMHIFCPWCDYRDFCPSYQEASKKTDYKFGSTLTMPDDELVAEWKSVRNTKKLLEVRERELGMIITEKIKAESANMACDNEEIYIRQNARKAYDLDAIYKYVPEEHFHNLVNVNKKAVDKYIDENPAVKNKIVESMVVNYTSPFLATKKLRNKGA
jgi:RecB family exonuclease